MFNCGVARIKWDSIPSEEISVVWKKSLTPCAASGALSLTNSFITICTAIVMKRQTLISEVPARGILDDIVGGMLVFI